MSEPTLAELVVDFRRDLSDLRALVLVLAREQEELREAIYAERRENNIRAFMTPEPQSLRA